MVPAVGKDGTASGQGGGQFLPFAGGGIAFHQGTGRPIPRGLSGQQGLVDVDLAAAGYDVARPLGHHRPCLVIVHVMQETAAGVDIAPEVEGAARADFTPAQYQGFRVERFGKVVAPGEGVQGAEQVGHKGRARPFAAIAPLAGELAEDIAAGMADDIRILELGQVVLMGFVGRAVTAGLCRFVGRAHGGDLRPGVFAGIGITGDHRVGYIVTDLNGGFDGATVGRAKQPIADTDNAVFEAVR